MIPLLVRCAKHFILQSQLQLEMLSDFMLISCLYIQISQATRVIIRHDKIVLVKI